LFATPGTLPTPYVDRNLVAVDKPPGLPSLGGSETRPSVASILLASFPEMAEIDRRRSAGLVHRIDTGTSGLLLAARNPVAYRRLRREFRLKAVAKDYLAVVRGSLREAGHVTLPLRRRSRNRSRMVPARASAAGWPAVTDFTPLLTCGDLTFLRLRMRTGVTHQLRVHMATLGHPVLGDQRYGSSAGSGVKEQLLAPGWHYLHALALRFDAPDLPQQLETPFPAHWISLFERIGWPAEAPR
jgi:RluA family pseudouridine synthase